MESLSGVGEIAHRRNSKTSGIVDTESYKSVGQKHSLTDGTKRHKKKFNDVGDTDDVISYTSQRSKWQNLSLTRETKLTKLF